MTKLMTLSMVALLTCATFSPAHAIWNDIKKTASDAYNLASRNVSTTSCTKATQEADCTDPEKPYCREMGPLGHYCTKTGDL